MKEKIFVRSTIFESDALPPSGWQRWKCERAREKRESTFWLVVMPNYEDSAEEHVQVKTIRRTKLIIKKESITHPGV